MGAHTTNRLNGAIYLQESAAQLGSEPPTCVGKLNGTVQAPKKRASDILF
jgi:hypothetical protein